MDLLVWLAILVILILVAWFLLAKLSLPEPAGTIIQIVVVIVVALVAINFLLEISHGSIGSLFHLH